MAVVENGEAAAADQLPEAHSLPDGFVDGGSSSSSREPVIEQLLTENDDYKDEKLVELDSRPGLIVTAKMVEGEKEVEKKENIDHNSSSTFSIPEVAAVVPDCNSNNDNNGDISGKSDQGSSEKYEQPSLPGGNKLQDQQQPDCQSSEKAIEGHLESRLASTKEISPTENAGSNKKAETSEVKRKNLKRMFKSEKEFLEFTLKYQQVVAERDAAITVRDKLESLCRELQRQNKMLMDECKRVSMEGQNLRLDISNKFQDAIQEVSNKLEEQKGECLSQLKENEMLRSNLKQFADQYALSEQHHAQTLKQKNLELQLAELKIQQYEEKLVQEQSQIKLYAEQVSQLLSTEKNLHLQLTADGAKFQQFQDALVKSNEVFETFKQEIEKMTKSIKELKTENTFLKGKCEKSDVTLIQLVEEREHMKKQLEKTRNQKEKLEALCRSLQAERKQSPSSINGGN